MGERLPLWGPGLPNTHPWAGAAPPQTLRPCGWHRCSCATPCATLLDVGGWSERQVNGHTWWQLCSASRLQPMSSPGVRPTVLMHHGASEATTAGLKCRSLSPDHGNTLTKAIFALLFAVLLIPALKGLAPFCSSTDIPPRSPYSHQALLLKDEPGFGF